MTSTLTGGAFDARSTGRSVDYRVLMPANQSGPLPLILHLHGAMSSAVSLDNTRGVYDQAWSSGELPAAVVACVSTPTLGGFYIDHPGAAWEQLVGTEFPAHISERFELTNSRVIFGSSMGGYGALKLAFRDPDTWLAVAALCPVIFPAETAAAVPERNRPSVLSALNADMGADQTTYESNSVYGLARVNRDRLLETGLRIFFDCGDADEFNLHDGATYLHRTLETLGISHSFRSVPGAGHADAHTADRQATALAFLARALTGN